MSKSWLPVAATCLGSSFITDFLFLSGRTDELLQSTHLPMQTLDLLLLGVNQALLLLISPSQPFDLALLFFDDIDRTTPMRSYLTPSTSPLSLCVTSNGSTFATSSATRPISNIPPCFQLNETGCNRRTRSRPRLNVFMFCL